MSLAHNNRVRAIGSAVATVAIPAVVLGSLAVPAEAAELPTRNLLQPKAATPAMVKAAEARISANLVAVQVPGVNIQMAAKGGTTTVKNGDTLSHISVRTDLSIAELKKFNKLSSDRIYPGQVLKLSGGSSKSSSSGNSSSSDKAQSYTVKNGDVMGTIAKKLGVSLSAVRNAAGNPSGDTIMVGQTLRFGSSKSGSGNSKSSSNDSNSSSSSTYTVKSGDFPSTIAIRHNMSVSAFMSLNNLSANDRIYPGDKMKVSGSSKSTSNGSKSKSTPTKTTGSSSYTVVSGDTLGHIAVKTNTPQNTLLKLNSGLTYSTVLRIGRVLKVNGGGSSSSAPSSVKPTSNAPRIKDSFLGRSYGSSTNHSANENKAELLSRDLPSRAQMKSMVASTARQMGVNPALAMAHAFQESTFDMDSVSPANAVGVMQVIPAAGEWAEGLVGRQLDLLDPQDNVTAGVAIIRAHQNSAGSREKGIAYYYQGAAGVERNGMYEDTKDYVASILSHMKNFS